MPSLARLRGSRCPGRTRNAPRWDTAHTGGAVGATIWGWVARKLAEGRAGPGRSHTRASEAGKRRPLQTVAWAGDTGRRCTGTRQRARLTREPPGLGADGRANATSDICAVSLTLGWRGQEESEFCPGDPMASGSTAVPFPCEGWGAAAVSSLLSHGSPSPVFLTCHSGDPSTIHLHYAFNLCFCVKLKRYLKALAANK